MHIRSTLATLYIIAATIFGGMLHAQENPPFSIHRAESERHAERRSEEEWDRFNGYLPGARLFSKQAACSLQSIVFGWHPYWGGTTYNDYDYSLLSDVCYFSYEVDPSTGGYTTIHNWKTTELVQRAKENGVRVHLCVTLFGGHASLLENATSRRTLIDSLIALVRLRDGNGVNIDFEGVPSGQRENLASFMRELGERFHTEIPGSIISIALPSVDWGNAFDVEAMVPYVDLFIIMGYDYHWRGGPQAGPVAPKNSGQLWGTIDVTRSINNYLSRGIPPRKLSLGVPYYGYDWPTIDSTLRSATTGPGTAILYTTAKERAAQYGRRWDAQSSTPYYIYDIDSWWHQVWYDDEESLGLKYDLVKMKGLAGIGIWALGYDASRNELWDLIEQKFTSCAASPCEGSFSDMGGPAGNYYNNERYTFTIAPAGASSVSLSFYSFNIADDRLLVFNGPDTTSPLLGSFSGTSNPGSLTATSGAMTLQFISDGDTTSWGWIANWSCALQPQSVTRDDRTALPSDLRIHPNPLDGSAAIEYEVRASGRVRLILLDMLGNEVMLVVDDLREAGTYRHMMRAKESGLPAGAYMLLLKSGDISIERMIIVR